MNNTDKLRIEGTVLKSCHNNIKGEVVIPDNVTEIGESAFRDRTGLTTIVIPDSVTKIGPSAFSGCTGQQIVRVGLNFSKRSVQEFTLETVVQKSQQTEFVNFSKTDRNIERYVVE